MYLIIVTGENVSELISNIESKIILLVKFLENKFNEIFLKYDMNVSKIDWEWYNRDIPKFDLLKQ